MAQNRSVFEEVSTDQGPNTQRHSGLIDNDKPQNRQLIRVWLMVLAALVLAMIVVGGLTRLTDSGLSITEWRPVTGVVPPLNDTDWQSEFIKYQAIPEYQLQNKGMSLEEFKLIYWWEWGHRLLGRVVGLVWAVGFIGIAVTKRIPQGWTQRLLLVGALGALQGVIGWWMVASGLGGERVDVASYRLAAHLGLAFVILGFITWYVLLLGRSEASLISARRGREAKLFSISTGLLHFTFLQIILGALVAGIDAGRAFPTWPDMNGQFFPADAFYVPDGNGGSLAIWHAFFENPGLVQFMHRMSGYLLMAFGVVVWLRGRRSAYAPTRFAFNAILVMMLIQMGLGIAAVVTAAHVHVALTHQLGAALLWVFILRGRFLAQYPKGGVIQ